MAKKMQSGSGTTRAASYPGGQQRNSQDDTHYITVPRLQRDDYRRLKDVINHPALRTGSGSAYGSSHASPQGDDAGRYSFGGRPSAPHASQTQPGDANRDHSAAYLPYTQRTLHQAPLHDYSEPYNAVGGIRRDGQVYDNVEVYEEYRPYGQVGRFDENRSDGWTNV